MVGGFRFSEWKQTGKYIHQNQVLWPEVIGENLENSNHAM
jgi:hypothetical protein